MNIEIWSLLFLAFGLGMLHALDADHIMAVSSLSCQKPDKKKSLVFCSRWAMGHGAAVMVIGVAVIFLGAAIPEALSETAESLVGLVLIALGGYVLWDMLRKRAHLHFHRHDGINDHAHWHSHQHPKAGHQTDSHKHSHAPVFVGLLHGTAGSAPLLALLPLSQMASPWTGFTYLLLFGIGVFISMLLFGGLLGQVFAWLKQWGDRFINTLRILVSMGSMGYGASLVMVHF